MPHLDGPVTVQIETIYKPDDPIHFVNYFRFSNVSADVIFEVGIVDDQSVIRMLGDHSKQHPAGEEFKIKAFVKSRMGMSIHSFLQLREKMNELYANMVKSGTIEDPGRS
jgi:hypothetical protein